MNEGGDRVVVCDDEISTLRNSLFRTFAVGSAIKASRVEEVLSAVVPVAAVAFAGSFAALA